MRVVSALSFVGSWWRYGLSLRVVWIESLKSGRFLLETTHLQWVKRQWRCSRSRPSFCVDSASAVTGEPRSCIVLAWRRPKHTCVSSYRDAQFPLRRLSASFLRASDVIRYRVMSSRWLRVSIRAWKHFVTCIDVDKLWVEKPQVFHVFWRFELLF